MNLSHFKTESFPKAIKTLFAELNIPINPISEDVFPVEATFPSYKANNPAHALIDELYAIGTVDDQAFKGVRNIDESELENEDYEFIMIFGIKLKDSQHPTRSQLAEITRLANASFNNEQKGNPVTVIYQYGENIALANTDRQTRNSSDYRQGEKLGKVSLLRDIDIEYTHSGHRLLLNELKISAKVSDYQSLYKHWQEKFSVSLLNRKFYQELSNWYFWATKHVSFPGKPGLVEATKRNMTLEDLENEHNATNVIRMLTRLLFVWFIKEKKLIPEELFDLNALQKNILKEINPYHETGLFTHANKESVYYKAILQNLFFASLNCPIEPDSIDKRSRGFRGDGYGTHRGIDYLMRYKKYFRDPDAFLTLVNDKVPFLNGGLFECLDDKANNNYIDGFSDQMTKNEILVVPDYLFFGTEEKIDLSKDLGVSNAGTKNAAVKGLINILKSYKFTIAENTPIEEEVALDPELLGKVFENLLASYNPETKTTARKQTGSFYTPREIVNYMVDESLMAYLKNSLETDVPDTEYLESNLNALTSYGPELPFDNNPQLKQKTIEAISKCTILDPACGSGAYPMGILQKMVHMLQKLDPDNIHWKEVQRAKILTETEEAFDITDKNTREERLLEINNAFDQDQNDPDYARKLFLIENCIYGVDIQPIATQISKLRFFISLVVDQKVLAAKANFGIRPLPNLETKFVAANTLIGISKPKTGDQLAIYNTENLKQFENKLKNTRHKLFNAKSKETKLKYRELDKELRTQIGKELKDSGWANDAADMLANWDPYDQNTSSPFFDKEWMFDIRVGFNIVIGNPPYVEFKNLHKSIKASLVGFETTKGKYDLYIPFIERGLTLLQENGSLVYICPTRLMQRDYGEELRKYLIGKSKIKTIIDFGDKMIFETATAYTGIFHFENTRTNNYTFLYSKNIYSADSLNVNSSKLSNKPWYFDNDIVTNLFNRLRLETESLEDIADGIIQGIATGKDSIFLIKENVILENNLEMELLEPFLMGKDISTYKINWSGKYCIYPYDSNGKVISESILKDTYPNIYNYLLQNKSELGGREYFENSTKLWYELWNQRAIQKFRREKIVTLDNASRNSFAFDNNNFIGTTTTYSIPINSSQFKIYYVLALINSKLLDFYHKKNTAPQANGFYRYQATFIKNFPIKKAYSEIQQPFIALVDKILVGKKVGEDTQEWEDEIDLRVYKLYELTHAEVLVIDPGFGMSEEEYEELMF
jgi:adenine-specific DNA-methyltransferase